MKSVKTKIYYSCYNSLLGNTLIASSAKGICHVSFFPRNENLSSKKLQCFFPNNEVVKQKDSIHQKVLDVINGKTRSEKNIVLDISGTDFQQKVWQAVTQIPFGKTSTYREIAHAIGNPKAVRAVGSAIGKNAIAILIPCHRVICSSGKLGGYKWGIELKKKILEMEYTYQAFR